MHTALSPWFCERNSLFGCPPPLYFCWIQTRKSYDCCMRLRTVVLLLCQWSDTSESVRHHYLRFRVREDQRPGCSYGLQIGQQDALLDSSSLLHNISPAVLGILQYTKRRFLHPSVLAITTSTLGHGDFIHNPSPPFGPCLYKTAFNPRQYFGRYFWLCHNCTSNVDQAHQNPISAKQYSTKYRIPGPHSDRDEDRTGVKEPRYEQGSK